MAVAPTLQGENKQGVSFFRLCLPLIVLLLWGCAAQQRAMDLPPGSTTSLRVQFGARVIKAGQSIPLQGVVQMAENGGTLVLILPHGRTFGVCAYVPSKMADQTKIEKMHCVPAAGLDSNAEDVLMRTGLAIYRMLPTLASDKDNQNVVGQGWSIDFMRAREDFTASYAQEDGLHMEFKITEISRP